MMLNRKHFFFKMGKLNLLHHKEWHVYSKKNREQVKKDEKEAFQNEVAIQARAIQAEQERRTEQLRKRAGKTEEKKDEHINLFQDYEQRLVAMDKLEDEDKKKEKDKWEKQLTTYLVDPESDSTNAAPWYAKSEFTSHKNKDEDSRAKKRDERSKHNMDPLTNLEKVIPKKREKEVICFCSDFF